MAIPPTEVRYRKALQYFILVVSGFLIIMIPLTIFLSNGTKSSPVVYLTLLPSMLVVGFISRWLYRRASTLEPVLVFTSEGLEVPIKNNRFIPWGEITEWKIRRDKSSHSLIIRTPQHRTRIDITWLDVPVKEIERMMAMYIRQPGPGGVKR